MPFTVTSSGSIPVIQIRGKFLGSIEGTAFREALEQLKSEDKRQVVVDLSATDFMDSSGIGTLIGGLTTMRNAGGDMRLAAIENRIKNLFIMTRLLGGVFENYSTVEDAAKSFA